VREVEEHRAEEGGERPPRGRLPREVVEERQHREQRGEPEDVRDEAPGEEPAERHWRDDERGDGVGAHVPREARGADGNRGDGGGDDELGRPAGRHRVREPPAEHVEELVGLPEVVPVKPGREHRRVVEVAQDGDRRLVKRQVGHRRVERDENGGRQEQARDPRSERLEALAGVHQRVCSRPC
jgi:hypothetical protein